MEPLRGKEAVSKYHKVLKATAQIRREGTKQDPEKEMTRGDEQKPKRNQRDRALNEDKGACVWQKRLSSHPSCYIDFPQVLPTTLLGGIGNASPRIHCTERQEDGLVSTGTSTGTDQGRPMFCGAGIYFGARGGSIQRGGH